MLKNVNAFFVILPFFVPLPAQAYIGPGIGGGIFFGTLALLFGIVLLLFTSIYYPIKKIIKKNKRKQKGATSGDDGPSV